jgi:hypothetical protein
MGRVGNAAQKAQSLLGKKEANGRRFNAIKGHLFRGFSKTDVEQGVGCRDPPLPPYGKNAALRNLYVDYVSSC